MPNTQITEESLPLPWERAAAFVPLVKQKAARQFLAIWRAHRDRQDAELRWGEEIEYMLLDISGGRARAALCADEVLRRLGAETDSGDPATGAGWRTEYGNMMVEGVTLPPYGWSLEDVLRIEPSLAWRRRRLERVAAEVSPTVRVATLAAFPLLGVGGHTQPPAEPSPDGRVSRSHLCADEVTSPHPRYQTFTANYRKRKGCKVGAFIPREGVPPERRLTPEQAARMPFQLAAANCRDRDPVEGHIYMDSQAFGACQCCTQATFLTRNLEEARHLADQFLVLAPLLLALTAATPFLRGLVADTDTRWPCFNQTWDDRQEAELDSVCNSRCSANDLFIGAGLLADEARERAVNDVDVPVDAAAAQELRESGLDALLTRHVAHILARDPMVVVEDRLEIDDEQEADHWEQLQGTNWGSVRLKPPPCAAAAAGGLGWRVEFRSPEVQPTDVENAAVVAVVRLLAEVATEEQWDLTIPVSLCSANDAASSERSAASRGLFWFPDGGPASAPGRGPPRRLPLAQILSGPGGLFTACRAWLDGRQGSGRCSPAARAALERYMLLLERRARGELPTPAELLRARLQQHPSYRGDGALPADFVHDVCLFAAELNRPEAAWPEELLGAKP